MLLIYQFILYLLKFISYHFLYSVVKFFYKYIYSCIEYIFNIHIFKYIYTLYKICCIAIVPILRKFKYKLKTQFFLIIYYVVCELQLYLKFIEYNYEE